MKWRVNDEMCNVFFKKLLTFADNMLVKYSDVTILVLTQGQN